MTASAHAGVRETGVLMVQPLMQVTWSQNLPLIGMQVVIVSWIFILGSCFGSFLNVVIYRLPAGMSLGKPKSRCPQCETPLAVKDNVPVFGWLALRGKCRYCGLPIAARYPVIEAICGGVFLALLFGELLTGAANLPIRHPDHFHVNTGFWLVWFMKWDLAGIYFYHCCLLVVVLAVVMIGYDGHRPQWPVTVFGLVVGVVAGTFCHELRPVPAVIYPAFLHDVQWGLWWNDPLVSPGSRYWTGVSLTGFFDGIAGVVGGVLAGGLVRWQMGSSKTESVAGSPIAAISSAMVIVGAFLGWQACGMLCLMILPLLMFCKVLDRSNSEQRFQRIAAPGFFAVLFAFLLMWKRLDDAVWVIGSNGWDFTTLSWWQDWLATVPLMFVFATAVRWTLANMVHHEAISARVD